MPDERLRCVVCHTRRLSKLPAPSARLFFFTKILLDSPVLASIRCLVDELDDIRGQGKINLDTSSHVPHHQCLFS